MAMREGEVVRPSPKETVTCIRSGQSGGPFVFDLELAAGAKGPPTHTHDEGDEIIEVLEGEVVFRVDGQDKLLRAGDSLTLTPTDAHTFWNPSKTASVRARVTHGPRFERFIVQPDLTSMLMYLCYVDPGASRATNPVMKMAMRVIARVGRLRGVRLVGVGEPESNER
jgi:mannose-6-phosphate isomerase-like protein (cupin superfamily)